jgi:hypothetical protein
MSAERKFLPVMQIEGGWALDNSYDGDTFEIDKQTLARTDTYEVKFRVWSELNECYQFRKAYITESDIWSVPMISVQELERIGALSPDQYSF